MPGTPDASPDTQITVLGVSPRNIIGVRVTGSASGAHAGALRSYSGDRGASFILDRPLMQGERVNVRAAISGRSAVVSSFTVAHLARVLPVLNIPTTQPAKLDHFVSQPSLLPPRITVNRGSATGGAIFLTPCRRR